MRFVEGVSFAIGSNIMVCIAGDRLFTLLYPFKVGLELFFR